MSLREFANKLKLSAAFVSDVELGRRSPSDKALADMAKVLGASPEEIKKYDTRPPVEDVRRLATSNPAYGFAFRKLIDHEISPEDLIKLAESKGNNKKKK